MDRPQLLKRLETAWQAFTSTYAGLSESELLEPGVTGAWSVRDIVAHVTTWEEEALQYLPLILEGGKPPRYSATYGGIDAFNARMTEQKRGLSLAEVLRQQAETHQRVIGACASTPTTTPRRPARRSGAGASGDHDDCRTAYFPRSLTHARYAWR